MKIQNLGLIGKVILGAGILVTALTGNAKADTIYMDFKNSNPGVATSSLSIKHTAGATEEYGYRDVTFLESPSPALDIWSEVSFNPYKLKVNALPPESMTTIYDKISGRGLSTSVDNELRFQIAEGENNFLNKNIFADLYSPTGTLQGTYNVKDYAANGWTVPVTISNGLSYTMNVRFEPAKAGDFNVDGNVDILDLGILAENWLNDNCSSLNNYCDFSDMNKDTEVNLADFAEFANQ